MKKLILIILIFSIYANVYSQDLPKNPKPGKCYLKCFVDNTNQQTEWKEIGCVELKSLDKNNILATQYKLINLGYKIEPTGCLNNETMTAYKDFKKNKKKIERRLKKEKRKKNKSS